MTRETAELLGAIGSVTQHVPRVITELAAGQVSPGRQREFAGLLSELADLLNAHADDQENGVMTVPEAQALAGQDELLALNSRTPEP